MTIVRHFETEDEYRKYPALSSSLLSQYWHNGLYSPDHALMRIEFKSYFEYGKMFETLLQDTVKGTDEFHDRFFQSKASGKMPDELIKWIDENQDLEQHYTIKKDGSRSKTGKTKHAFLDEAQENAGKIPVSIQDWDMLQLHVDRMCKMKYHGVLCGDLLSKGEWQVPIKWKDDIGVDKKALLDVIVDLGGSFLLIDIKTSHEEKKFGYMLKDKYWIQDNLYSEGVEAAIGPLHHQHQCMLFLVAYKTAPYLCQPRCVDYADVNRKAQAIDEYNELCESYSRWNGKPKGWLPLKTDKLYLPSRREV